MVRLLVFLALAASSLGAAWWLGEAPHRSDAVQAAERQAPSARPGAATLASLGRKEARRAAGAPVATSGPFAEFEGRPAAEIDDDGLAELLAALRCDEVRMNATRAASTLSWHVRDGGAARRIAALATPLLRSDDRQQRIMVTALCMHIATVEAEAGRPSRPPADVTEAAMRWLGGPGAHPDALDFRTCYAPYQWRARRFCEALETHVRQDLRELLLRPVNSIEQPNEARFEAAWILTVAGAPWPEDAAAVLVEHLADNHIDEDAVRAMYALKHLGPAALPALETARATSSDLQQRLAAELVLAELHTPGSSRAFGRKAQRIFHSAVPFPAADWSPRFMW
ncbi:hypothetical protein OAQ71_00155 [bacterium]|nr:hypothetical protein [bacterium]